MLSIMGILVIVTVIIAIDVPPLWRKKLKKELWAFSILLLFGTVLGLAQALKLKIPNPLDWVIAVYKPLSDMVDIWLK
ncbi:hypothetical protein [Paenibacillus macquariensis]|uniref:Uncharacterized protein n=1 Tax=Paenibacillus macquariensis TaxID=948756 RepID=A0ABY1JRT5_9BACL|nr:hypothetical protein [Paenibacillus macquariensis]MEC0092784.1 hypothetical protein [Paenibacillus macquariensis]OAB36170.1 hypothetical protein PMSM_06870 [Paenibacillus macquariensis subsp. macquariensis]SIQ66164.1 hypothetical protein SAMN05421578_103231 [Paenibacillus macquariensis]